MWVYVSTIHASSEGGTGETLRHGLVLSESRVVAIVRGWRGS